MTRSGIWFLLGIFVVLSVLTPLDAQCVAELDVGEATGLPGGPVKVQVVGEASCDVTGFSLAIGHDPAILSFVDAAPGQFLVGHAGTDLSFLINSQPGFTVVGALFDISFPLTIPATSIASGTVLATIDYDILSGASPGVTALLNRTKTFGGDILVFNIFSRPPGGVPVEPVLVDGAITVEASSLFRRGDANADGWLDISDVITILLQLFRGRPALCGKSADVDDSGTLSLTDAVFLVEFIFGGGPTPAAPLDVCGADLTSDSLTCASFPICE